MKKKKLFLLTILFLTFIFCQAQNNNIDSLKNIIEKGPNDSNKVIALIEISKLMLDENPKLVIKYCDQAIELSQKIKYSKGEAIALKYKGICYYTQSDYFDAVQNWSASLAVYKKSNDKVGEANILSNLGAIYFNQADDIKALDYYLNALKLAEEINDSLRLATVLMNIGSIYHKDLDKALKYFLRALPISEGIKNKDAIGTVNVNIGEIYFLKGDYITALPYLEKSLKAYQGSENITYSYILIGKVYNKLGDYEKAKANQAKALEIAKELHSKLDIARALLALANTYHKKGDIRKSIELYLEGIDIAKIINANIELKNLYQGVSEAYRDSKNYNQAYDYQRLLLEIKDTLYNNETDKKLSTLMFNYDLEKKENKINLLTKDKEIQEQNIKRQKQIRNTFIFGFAIVIVFAGIFFRQRNRISKEKQRSEKLLLNILPEETAKELKATGTAKAKSFEQVTVLFTDFKDFTKLSEKLSPTKLVEEINECFSAFDRIMEKYGIEKIKTIGDAYMAAGGLPTPNNSHPIDVVSAALEIKSFMIDHQERKSIKGEPSFQIRIGIHTGPVVAGVVGVNKFQYDIWGDSVNTASRMESSGEVGKVNISGTTYELIKERFNCVYRGKVDAKNKGQINMYFVEGRISA